jgi:hypothetical protein
MATNTEIMTSFYTIVRDSTIVPSASIGYDGKSFTPPNTGNWLELSFMPNRGIDQSLSSNAILKQGLLQVNIGGRPNKGIAGLQAIADQVAALFPKNTVLSGIARVSSIPYASDDISMDDRTILPVTISYSE